MKQKKRVKEGLIPADIMAQHTVSTTTTSPPANNSSNNSACSTPNSIINSGKNPNVNQNNSNVNNIKVSNPTTATLTDCQLSLQHNSDNSRESI